MLCKCDQWVLKFIWSQLHQTTVSDIRFNYRDARSNERRHIIFIMNIVQEYTRNLAIANRSRVICAHSTSRAYSNYAIFKSELQVTHASRSLDMTAFDRSRTYEFLLAFRSNYGAILYRLRYTVYWELLVENLEIFTSHLYLARLQGWPYRNFAKNFDNHKLEWLGYRVVKKLWRYVKPFRYVTGTCRTDGQTELLYQYQRTSARWET